MLNLAIYVIYKKTLAEYKIKKTMCDTNKKSCFANTSESWNYSSASSLMKFQSALICLWQNFTIFWKLFF
jgi:hypothetical protein